MVFDKLQLKLILGLYYIDKSRNIESFTARFNRYFHLSISAQTILFALAQFKNVDPSTNIKITEDMKPYQSIWMECIPTGLDELKEIYKVFRQEKFLSIIDCKDDSLADIEITNAKDIPRVDDSAEAKPINLSNRLTDVYPRLKEVANNALRLAEYKCENTICGTHLFLRKDGKTNYTEAHHLIPLQYQKYSDFSLDVEANVVSLCPNCHCLLHYGQDKEELLRQLYNQRISRLQKCNLDIGFEDLLLMYR